MPGLLTYRKCEIVSLCCFKPLNFAVICSAAIDNTTIYHSKTAENRRQNKNLKKLQGKNIILRKKKKKTVKLLVSHINVLKEEKNKISELTKITFKNNDKTKMSLNQNNKTMGEKNIIISCSD